MDFRNYVKELLQEVTQNVTTDTVFGASRETGDKVVIPVAQVSYGGGGGFGSGGDEKSAESGEGGGMGLSIKAKPLGVIVVTADDVVWMPVWDVTRIAVVGCAVVVLALMCMRMMSAGGCGCGCGCGCSDGCGCGD